MNDRLAKAAALASRHRYDAAFALGGLLTLGLPPLGIFPVIFLAFPAQMWLTATAGNARQAFLTGWAFGGGYFILGLYWMGIAFREMYAELPWFFPFAVFGIPLYIALHYAAASWAAFRFRGQPVAYVFAFAVFFFWVEYLRGHFPGNFPWNAPGEVWYHVLPVMQSVALFGIYGLTFMTLLWAALPFLAVRKNKSAGERGTIALIVVSFFIVAGWGSVRLLLADPSFHPGTSARILQANVTQEEKIAADSEGKDESFDRYIALMRKDTASAPPVTFFIWPETVFDARPGNAASYFSRIAAFLPTGSHAAVGIHRIVAQKGRQDIYNSLVVIDSAGKVLATYDKSALAPWGEYVPLDGLLQKTPLARYLSGILRLRAGTGPQTFRIGNLPAFSPVICFESAFSGRVLPRHDRPGFLLFVANDAWSSGSVGPFQHFGFARLRAIEEGLPVLRAANIGISAVFDPYGRELQRLGLHQTGVLNTALPVAAPPTPFSRFGDIPLLGGVAILTLAILFAGRWGKALAGDKRG